MSKGRLIPALFPKIKGEKIYDKFQGMVQGSWHESGQDGCADSDCYSGNINAHCRRKFDNGDIGICFGGGIVSLDVDCGIARAGISENII